MAIFKNMKIFLKFTKNFFSVSRQSDVDLFGEYQSDALPSRQMGSAFDGHNSILCKVLLFFRALIEQKGLPKKFGAQI